MESLGLQLSQEQLEAGEEELEGHFCSGSSQVNQHVASSYDDPCSGATRYLVLD